jgi:hypothetical protein
MEKINLQKGDIYIQKQYSKKRYKNKLENTVSEFQNRR